jgi:3-demethoxyubiquinol 3-hydroxylase
MSRRGLIDVAVVGAGVVGSALALALARDGRRVALVEARTPSPWSVEQPDLRVYAFAPDNAALLGELGVWAGILTARAHPYRRMRIWDAAGGDALCFDADALAQPQLGWIVEHGLLVDRLWQALEPAGVERHCPQRVVALEQDADSATLALDDGRRLRARLVVAADGSDSALRRLAGIDAERHDYQQRGLVAYVETERPHDDTCLQRFLPSGPIAFLPCADGRSSIVWTLPDAEAERLLAVDEATFCDELTRAIDAALGAVTAVSKRAAFPLRRQLARRYVAGRVVLAGDAAHTVHPLAGQGVNLGLRDVAALRRLLATAGERDFASAHRLDRYARERRSENAVAAWSFDGINRLFSNDAVLPTLVRGHLLGLVGKLPPLQAMFWRRAAGV